MSSTGVNRAHAAALGIATSTQNLASATGQMEQSLVAALNTKDESSWQRFSSRAGLVACVLRFLPLADKFSLARTCRIARAALAVFPIFGLPVAFVVDCKTSVDGYVLTCKTDSETKTGLALGAGGEAAAELLSIFQKYFLVVFTRNHEFLIAWTAARTKASAIARNRRHAIAAQTQVCEDRPGE